MLAVVWRLSDTLHPPQELFKKVVPHHCLGSIWSQGTKRGHEHLVPTVHNTVTHFQKVVNFITTTYLGNPIMTAQNRAEVVEFWIQVAKVCCRRAQGALSGAMGTAPSPFSALRIEVWGLSSYTVPRPLLPGAH